jgi:hypothetical protein
MKKVARMAEREAHRAPREEGRGGIALDAPARERDPVFARARGQLHPEARAGGGEVAAADIDLGLRAERVLDAVAEELHRGRVGGRQHHVAEALGNDADAFLLGDAQQERRLLLRAHRLQRRVDRLQVAHEVPDGRRDARLGHVLLQQPHRGRLRQHQRRDHHHQRAPQ